MLSSCGDRQAAAGGGAPVLVAAVPVAVAEVELRLQQQTGATLWNVGRD